MKIGIDIRPLLGGKRTGVEEYMLELLEHLFFLDSANEYILFWNAWKLPPCPRDWDRRFPHVRLASFRIPNKLLNFSLWYFGFPKLDRLIGGTDVFFVPNLTFAAFSRHTRVVVTAHDLSFELWPETFSWKRRWWHFFVHFRRLARRADRIICVSQSTKDDLVTFLRLSPRKVVVVQSGIDPTCVPMSRNHPSLLSVKERYRLPYRFVLSVGTIEPRKNIVSLAEAFDTLVREGKADGFELVLAGVKGWKWRGIREAIDRLPSRNRIRFLGFVEDKDKAALYNLASVFVAPSFYEGFGFPPLEAAACGTPVVVSNGSSFPETLGGGAILIDPLRPEDVRRALEELLRDRALSEKLSERGRALAERFSWGSAAAKTKAVFETLKKKQRSTNRQATR